MPTVEDFLAKNNIEYQLFEHPAVYTVAEAEVHCANIPGMSCKNILLTNKKQTR